MNAGHMAANEAIMDMLHGSGTGTGFAHHRAGKPSMISGRHSASCSAPIFSSHLVTGCEAPARPKRTSLPLEDIGQVIEK
jgi:hypothetical protein